MAQRHTAPPAEGIITDTIHIDTASIPDHVRWALARATLDLVREISRRPGGRERLDEKKRQLKKESRL